jgi:hypothetical protein
MNAFVFGFNFLGKILITTFQAIGEELKISPNHNNRQKVAAGFYLSRFFNIIFLVSSFCLYNIIRCNQRNMRKKLSISETIRATNQVDRKK